MAEQNSALSSQPSAREEAAGRAAFEAFCAAMRPYIPPAGVAPWHKQAQATKRAWIVAAIAARAS